MKRTSLSETLDYIAFLLVLAGILIALCSVDPGMYAR